MAHPAPRGCRGTREHLPIEARVQRTSQGYFPFEHFLLELLRDRVAVRRLGHGFAEGRTGAIETGVELLSHPLVRVVCRAP